jgi:hypothetical protein
VDDEDRKLELDPALKLPDMTVSEPPPKVYPRLNFRLRIAMWLAFIGGPLVIAMGLYEAYRGWHLKSSGQAVTGVLVSSEALNTGKGRTSYQIVVDYLPPGSKTKYRKRFVVGEEEFQQAKKAGSCTVRYLESDPAFSRVGDGGGDEGEMIAMGAGVLLFGAGVWWYLRRQLAAVEKYVWGGMASSLGDKV